MSKTNHKLGEKFVGAASSRPHFGGIAKKENGITLIALIITIIVMLILTGVTLSITLGDNGLVNKAKEATTQTQLAMERELLLSAVVAAIGEDGKVNLSAINLPEGFTGSNGTYTSKNGNTFTVSENGEITAGSEGGNEVETVDLNGQYYYESDGNLYEGYLIRNNNYISSSEGPEEFPFTIDSENERIIIDVSMENDNGIIEEWQLICGYKLILKNNEIVNKILIIQDMYIFYQNTEGFEYDLNGIYMNNDGTSRLIFDATNGYMDRQIRNDPTGNWGYYSGEEYNRDTYLKFNDKYYLNGEIRDIFSVSENLNTVTYDGVVYTKQATE